MTFKQVEDTIKSITFPKMTFRVEKRGRKYFAIMISFWCFNKDDQFSDDWESHTFIVSDEKIVPTDALGKMDVNTVIEMARVLAKTVYDHEFDEYFKFDKITVINPHVNMEDET
jgi:hypothetical protein